MMMALRLQVVIMAVDRMDGHQNRVDDDDNDDGKSNIVVADGDCVWISGVLGWVSMFRGIQKRYFTFESPK